MASTRITRTLSANGDKKLTISVWLKRSGLGAAQYICRVFSDANNQGGLYFTSGDNIEWFDYVGGAYKLRYITNAVFRDTSAWYHILAHFDNSLSTPEAKLYVNGVEQSLSTSTNYTQNQTTSWNNNYTFDIGSAATGTYFDGSMTHFYFIQNQKYAPTIFGETDSTSGIWKPKTSPTIDYSATGSNSCFLKFDDSSDMDKDSGDNTLSFTTTGTLTQTEDTPSNNFATLNPLYPYTSTGAFTNGNTAPSDYAVGQGIVGTLGVSSGKWYFEVKASSTPTENMIGWGATNGTNSASFPGKYANEYARYLGYATYYSNDTPTSISGASAYSGGDICGCALDLDGNKIYWYKNGVLENTGGTSITASSTAGYYFPIFRNGNGSNIACNFGNGYFGTTAVASSNSDSAGLGLFEYSVPSGYYALCTKNIKNYG